MSIFCTVEEAITDIRDGKIVIVVDDETRENEGDMILAADKVSPERINFLTKHARGLVCLALTEERSKELDLKPMVTDNTSKLGTAFTVSIDAVKGTTTGISAFDRTTTIKAAIDRRSGASDFNKPGHVFPLNALPGGVLRRAGHTEAAVDLAALAGCSPAGVLCEVLDDDGHMARLPQLARIAKTHGLKIVRITDLIAYRTRHEKLVSREIKTDFPTRYGHFELHLYKNALDDSTHVVLVKGTVAGTEPVLVRVHSECLTGDIFGSLRCDCGSQLERAMMEIEKEGRGVLVYMRQEGRGIGLDNKLKAYTLQDEGRDTVEANEMLGFPPDSRDYGIGAQILADLGVKRLKLLTNNPRKVVGLSGYGVEIVERIPLEVPPNENNVRYLSTKRDKLGHLLGEVAPLGRGTGTDHKE